MLWAFDCKVLPAVVGIPSTEHTRGESGAVLTRGPRGGWLPSHSAQAAEGAPLPGPSVCGALPPSVLLLSWGPSSLSLLQLPPLGGSCILSGARNRNCIIHFPKSHGLIPGILKICDSGSTTGLIHSNRGHSGLVN